MGCTSSLASGEQRPIPPMKQRIMAAALKGKHKSLKRLLHECASSSPCNSNAGARVTQSVIPTVLVRVCGSASSSCSRVHVANVVVVLPDAWQLLVDLCGVPPTANWDHFVCMALCLAGSRDYAEATKVMLTHAVGAQGPDLRNSLFETPLIITAEHGHADTMRVLLDHCADVEAHTLDGKTPGQISASWRHLRCVEMLVAHGCSIDHASHDLLSMRQYSAESADVDAAIARGLASLAERRDALARQLAQLDAPGAVRLPLDIVRLIARCTYGSVCAFGGARDRHAATSTSLTAGVAGVAASAGARIRHGRRLRGL